jgi:protein O-mannosyl-transferase
MPLRSVPTAVPAPVPGRADWTVLAAGSVLAAAAALAYSRTFSIPFLFDDDTSIAGNPTLRHLAAAFWPPAGATVSGRPVLNLSFALNYALSGTDVWSYHALNLAIHVLAGLILFGIVRRTILRGIPTEATGIAFAVALLWTVHPLLTESVTYLVQRAESLMGLFYLLTLYGFIRAAEAEGRARILWNILSFTACLLGMGTKEVMVTAPLVVLLYDRTFIAGSFAGALRSRRGIYGALAATWLFLAFLVIAADGRAGSAGFGSGVSWQSYALQQLPALVRYISLGLWPHPLVFDYGPAAAPQSSQVILWGLVVAGLVGATLWALARKPVPGFLGACFFLILAPSSSVVPVATEAMAEHRMYLALIPLVVLAVAALRRLLGNAAVPACAVLAGLLCFATLQRNQAYRSEEAIWADTVSKRPQNERAQDNLGFVLSKEPGRRDEAITHFEEAIRLKPDFVEAHYNLAFALLSIPGRLGDAIDEYEEALRLKPDLIMVRFNLARALQTMPGRSGEAIAQYEETIRRRPDFAEARYNLGVMLQEIPGRGDEAIAQYEEALRLKPEDAGAHFSLGTALQAVPGRLNDAVTQYEDAIGLAPNFARAHLNLGSALERIPGRSADAAAQYGEALRLEPANAEAHFDLGCVLQELPGRLDDAIAQYGEALRLAPGNVAALANLGNALNSEGRAEEAIARYAEASRLRPDDATIQLNFAVILLKVPGRSGEAAAHAKEALRLQPGNQAALDLLARIYRGGE